jgi:hypothetical protein
MENLLFVAPVVPYTLTLFFGDPFLAYAFAGALTVVCCLFALFSLYKLKQISFLLALLLMAYLVFSPSFIFLFGMRLSFNYTIATFVLCAYTLRKYYYESRSSMFFCFSTLLGLFAQQLIETPMAGLIFLPPLLAITHAQQRPYIPILIAAYFPSLVFLSAPMFLNLIFNGEFSLSGIYQSPLDTEILALDTKGNWKASYDRFFQALWDYLPLLIPYWLFSLRINQFHSRASYAMIWITPLLYLFFRIYAENVIPTNCLMMIFVLFSISFFAKSYGVRFEQSFMITIVLFTGYLISFGASFTLPMQSEDFVERAFFRNLLGLPAGKNLDTAQKLAKRLQETQGLVLMDDQVNFKIVYFTGTPARFILPYQYAFRTALSAPEEFVNYIIVSMETSHDKVLQAYPGALLGQIPGFEKVYELPGATLFQRNGINRG